MYGFGVDIMDRRLQVCVDLLIIVAIVVCCYRVYRWSPGAVQDCDSNYSLAAGEMFVKHGTLRLNDAMPADCSSLPGYSSASKLPYQLIRLPYFHDNNDQGAIYYGYPLGSVILSLPLIQHYTSVRHLSCFDRDGFYFADGERRLQQKLAAIVAAFAVGGYFLIARTLLPRWAAVFLALGFGFGSMTWSTLSRGMWSHTWLTVELSIAIWMLTLLVRYPERSRLANLIIGGIIGIAMVAIYCTRPQAIVSIAAISVYLALSDRRILFYTALSAVLTSAVGMALSFYSFGQLLPPSVYNPSDIDGRDILPRFWHLLMSPSRGLIIFCPYLLMMGYWLVVYRRNLGSWSQLLIPAALAIGAHVAVLSAYNGWSGGSCYGPRYFCDVLPWFVLVGSVAVHGLFNHTHSRIPIRQIVESAIFLLLLTWSVFVHGRGAISRDAWEWNYRAVCEPVPTAVTDWRHPQFLAGITFTVTPDGAYHELP